MWNAGLAGTLIRHPAPQDVHVDDGQLLVAPSATGTNASRSIVGVIRWQQGAGIQSPGIVVGSTIWTYIGSQTYGAFIAQPDGSGFAIGFKLASDDPLNDVVIVRGDGTEIKIPGRYVPAW